MLTMGEELGLLLKHIEISKNEFHNLGLTYKDQSIGSLVFGNTYNPDKLVVNLNGHIYHNAYVKELPIKSIERKVLLYNNIDTLQLIVAYPITMLAEIDGIGMKSINDLIRFVQLYCEITEFGDKYTDSKILKEYKDFRKKFSISY